MFNSPYVSDKKSGTHEVTCTQNECVCVCVSVCLWTAVCRNYSADFNQTYPNETPNGLVVCVCDLAH